jgi:hypothetical protein
MKEPFADTRVRHLRPFHSPDDHPPNFASPVRKRSLVTLSREQSSTLNLDLFIRRI